MPTSQSRPILKPIILTLLLLLTFNLTGHQTLAGELDELGPYAAGWRTFEFEDEIFGQGRLHGRIYYPAYADGQDQPADPTLGPYPLIGFQHGWLGSPDNYDDLCLHLASWGYVIASTGTEQGFFIDIEQYAHDTRSILHWAEVESNDPESWLSDMLDDGTWTVIGHSAGGGTLSMNIGIEPRIENIIGLQAAKYAEGEDNMIAFGGNVFMIAGSADWVVPSETVYHWTTIAENARRNVFWDVQGMGHTGCTDDPPNWEPMSGAEQHRAHRRLITGILQAEIRADDNTYLDTLGEGLDVPVISQTFCEYPILWVGSNDNSLTVGLAGSPSTYSATAWSLVPDEVETKYGTLGLSLDDLTVFQQDQLNAYGWTETELPIEPDWSGQMLYLQGLANQQLTRVIDLLIN